MCNIKPILNNLHFLSGNVLGCAIASAKCYNCTMLLITQFRIRMGVEYTWILGLSLLFPLSFFGQFVHPVGREGMG